MRTYALLSDDDLAHLAAIRAGIGIGICQIPLAAREADLAHLFADHFRYDLETWIVTHENLRKDRAVRVVFDVLAKGLADYVRG